MLLRKITVLILGLFLVAPSVQAGISYTAQSRVYVGYDDFIVSQVGISQGYTSYSNSSPIYSAPNFSTASFGTYISHLNTSVSGATMDFSVSDPGGSQTGNIGTHNFGKGMTNSVTFTSDGPFHFSSFFSGGFPSGGGLVDLANNSGAAPLGVTVDLPAGTYRLDSSGGRNGSLFVSATITVTPEPASLMLVPMAGVILLRRKKQ